MNTYYVVIEHDHERVSHILEFGDAAACDAWLRDRGWVVESGDMVYAHAIASYLPSSATFEPPRYPTYAYVYDSIGDVRAAYGSDLPFAVRAPKDCPADEAWQDAALDCYSDVDRDEFTVWLLANGVEHYAPAQVFDDAAMARAFCREFDIDPEAS